MNKSSRRLIVWGILFCLGINHAGAAVDRSAQTHFSASLLYSSPQPSLATLGTAGAQRRFSKLKQMEIVKTFELPLSAPATSMQGEAARKFLLEADRIIQSHRYRRPDQFLTQDQFRQFQMSILDAAHIWLSYMHIAHSLIITKSTDILGGKTVENREIRILPSHTSRLGQEAEELVRVRKKLLFKPTFVGMIFDGADLSLPTPFYPKFPISGLENINNPQNVVNLPIQNLLRPTVHKDEILSDYRHSFAEFSKMAANANDPNPPILSGFAIGFPFPIHREYLNQATNYWSLGQLELPRSMPLASPWHATLPKHIWFMRPVYDTFLIQKWLRAYEQKMTPDRAQSIKNVAHELALFSERTSRSIAHIKAALQLASQISRKDLSSPDQFVWQERDRQRWVRFSISTPIIDVLRRKQETTTVIFDLPLGPSNHSLMWITLSRRKNREQLRSQILTKLKLMNQYLADYDVLISWTIRFAHSLAQDNVPNPEQLFTAFASVFRQPPSPTTLGYRPLTVASLEEQFEENLKSLRSPSFCSELWR